jgi:hypothetical protein
MRHPAQFGHEVGELLDLLALPDLQKGAKRHGR